MGAVADIRHADQMVKNPSVFKKLFNGSSIEQEAMDVFAAKKKAEEKVEIVAEAVVEKAKPAKKPDNYDAMSPKQRRDYDAGI